VALLRRQFVVDRRAVREYVWSLFK
jgi:hypothetical protein